MEVPFDPAKVWGIDPTRLWRGRKGYRVLATLNNISFAGFIVSRQRRCFMLVDDDVKHEARVAAGDVVTITMLPTPGDKE